MALTALVSSCSTQAAGGDPGGGVPGRVLPLLDWKLTLPFEGERPSWPKEVFQPELASYSDRYFQLGPGGASVVFRADASGLAQPGSQNPRTELREMTAGGRQQARWPSDNGTHVMSIRQAINRVPGAIVAGQIHNSEKYIALIRLDGNRLYVKADDRNVGDLDPDYILGTVFTVRLEVADQTLRVFYNGELKVTHHVSCEACYFKAGAYLQTYPSYPNSSADSGEVSVQSLTVQHTPALPEPVAGQGTDETETEPPEPAEVEPPEPAEVEAPEAG